MPAAVVDATIEQLVPLLAAGDTIIDGGNSYYHDDVRRAKQLREKGLHYVDAGVSGGVWGLERGYCVMIGGETEIVQRLDPIFKALAPGMDSAARSFTEPPGFMNSALPRISQPVSSLRALRRISGVLPTAPTKPAVMPVVRAGELTGVLATMREVSA